MAPTRHKRVAYVAFMADSNYFPKPLAKPLGVP